MSNSSYFSQDGQDRYLDQQIFKGKMGGVFIEVGANDGVTFSNTFFLEKHRLWKGVCIEPHPGAFEKLKNNRTCTVINAGIGKTETSQDFLKIEGYSEMLSGLVSKYASEHLDRIDRELTAHGGSKQVVSVPCYRLDTIMKKYGVKTVDYCSVDTEGGEIEILETADLSHTEIKLISVENNYYGDKLGLFLKDHYYKKIKTIGADEFYKKMRKRFWFYW